MRAVTVEYDDSDRPVALAQGSGAHVLPPLESTYGAYQVVAPLARGGMGGVYLAAEAGTGRRVALKVLDERFARHVEIAERLAGEATIAARASHPGLLRIFGADFTPAGVPYLVMEYLDGKSLAGVDQVAVANAISIGAQVAAALAALHAGGAIHCDVKPDNIVVMKDGRVKVVDFGVSRLVEEGPLEGGAIAGTPWCMAPEQWQGAPEAASDVYALGCVLYQLVTGHAPFDGSLPELMFAHEEQRPARPAWFAAMPAAFERAILWALAKRPEDRPTMAELALVLAELADAQERRVDDADAPRAAQLQAG